MKVSVRRRESVPTQKFRTARVDVRVKAVFTSNGKYVGAYTSLSLHKPNVERTYNAHMSQEKTRCRAPLRTLSLLINLDKIGRMLELSKFT